VEQAATMKRSPPAQVSGWPAYPPSSLR
jgi:hypothetical protein